MVTNGQPLVVSVGTYRADCWPVGGAHVLSINTVEADWCLACRHVSTRLGAGSGQAPDSAATLCRQSPDSPGLTARQGRRQWRRQPARQGRRQGQRQPACHGVFSFHFRVNSELTECQYLNSCIDNWGKTVTMFPSVMYRPCRGRSHNVT